MITFLQPIDINNDEKKKAAELWFLINIKTLDILINIKTGYF